MNILPKWDELFKHLCNLTTPSTYCYSPFVPKVFELSKFFLKLYNILVPISFQQVKTVQKLSPYYTIFENSALIMMMIYNKLHHSSTFCTSIETKWRLFMSSLSTSHVNMCSSQLEYVMWGNISSQTIFLTLLQTWIFFVITWKALLGPISSIASITCLSLHFNVFSFLINVLSFETFFFHVKCKDCSKEAFCLCLYNTLFF